MGMVAKPFRYSHINARCRTLRAHFLDARIFDTLCASKSLSELYGYLGSTVYVTFLSEPSPQQLSAGLDRYFETLYRKLTRSLSQSENHLFSLFFSARKELVLQKQQVRAEGNAAYRYKEIDLAFVDAVSGALKGMKREERRDLHEIMGSYFDMLNLFSIVRLKTIYRLDIDEVIPFLIPYGLHFNLPKLAELARLSSIEEISHKTEPVFGASYRDVAEFRQVLCAYHGRSLERAWLGFPFKSSIVFALLRQQEIEIKNLKAVIEGVTFQMPPTEISRMVVGVGR